MHIYYRFASEDIASYDCTLADSIDLGKMVKFARWRINDERVCCVGCRVYDGSHSERIYDFNYADVPE